MPKPPVSSDRIKKELTDMILSGDLQPGDVLKEGVLAEHFGVSRTPIREAIRQIASTGLITLRPRQRSVVSKLALGDALKRFEAMSLLEGACAELAAMRRSEDALAEMRDLHSQGGRLVETGDVDAYFEINEQLHDAIYRASGNEFLEQKTREMRSQLQVLRVPRKSQPARMQASYDEHTRIVNAMIAGDPNEARAAMRDHTLMQGETLMDFVSSFERRFETDKNHREPGS